MSDLTRKEREAINLAFAAIEYECEACPHEYRVRLMDALRLEKTGRGLHYAKALICGQFLAGFENGETAIAPRALWNVSPGLVMAFLLGGAIYKRGRLANPPELLLRALKGADDALAANLERRTR